MRVVTKPRPIYGTFIDGSRGFVDSPHMKFTSEQLTAFGIRLADARSATGWTRERLIEHVDTIGSAQQLYNYEKGMRAPETVDIVYDLEDALNLPPSSLAICLGFARPHIPVRLGTLDAIAQDPRLSVDAREALMAAYRTAAVR